MKPPKNYSLTIMVGLAIVLYTSSCSNILKADFEADAVGGKPNASLPGAPLGDKLDFSSLPPAVSIVDEKIEGAHALELTNIDFGKLGYHDSKWLTFYAKPGKINRIIDFKWSAKTVNFPSGGDVTIDVALSLLPGHGGESMAVALITINRFGEVTASAYESINPSSTALGDLGFADAVHKMEVSVDTEKDQFTVKLISSSKSFAPITLPILEHPEWFNKSSSEPKLSFNFSQPYSASQKYILDDVRIEN